MQRKADCRKYKKWKEEQAKKVKRTKKKVNERERKELTADCVAEAEKEISAVKPALNFDFRKCKRKKKKRKKPNRLIRKLFKHVSMADLLLSCIKPPLEDRMYIINERHNACLELYRGEMDSMLKNLLPSSSGLTSAPGQRNFYRRKKPCQQKKAEKLKSNDEECDSICSFDSDICLAGVKLTSQDRKELKKYRDDRSDSNKEEEK